jgi:hypothetical protein
MSADLAKRSNASREDDGKGRHDPEKGRRKEARRRAHRAARGVEGGGGGGVGPFEFVGQILGTHARPKSCDVESRRVSSAHCPNANIFFLFQVRIKEGEREQKKARLWSLEGRERIYGRENNYGIGMQGKSNHRQGQMSRERSEARNACRVVREGDKEGV